MIDIVMGLIFIIAFFLGLGKGLVRSLASLVGLVAGVYCAMFFSGYVQVYLERWFHWSHDLYRIASFLITFFIIMFFFALLGRVLTKLVNFAMMGMVNKILGGIFNVLKYAFLLSVVFMFVNASEDYRILSREKRDASYLYHPVAALAPAILPAIERQMEHMDIEPNFEYPTTQPLDTLPQK